MRINLKLNPTNYFLIFLFAFLHILYLDTPFVNFEWVYRQGTQYFLTNNSIHLESYFTIQANPLTYSFIVSKLITYSGIDSFFLYRMPALVGGILMLVALARYNQPFLILIVGLNPLIWIYSGRSYSELLAAGLMMISYECQRKPAVSGAALAVSSMIKYHSLPFMLINSIFKWAILNWQEKLKLWNISYFWSGLISGFSFIGFIVFYKHEFGFWFAPPYFVERHGTFLFSDQINNLFSYGFYLSAMFFFTLFFFLNSIEIKQKFTLFIVSAILAFNNENLGEMDFGSFQQLIGSELILLIKIIGFWNFLLCCSLFWKDKRSRILLLTIIAYILLLSLTRPANRYLIFVIPFWAILIHQHISLKSFFWWGYSAILTGLNLFATLYQINNSTASLNMANWAAEQNLKINLGGILYAHVGDSEYHDPTSPLVVSLSRSASGQVLHEEQVSVLGFPIRSYVLTKIDSN